MTLLPTESRVHIRGVAAEKYPLNKRCSHPEHDHDAVDAHHCFRRSEQIGASWFVEIRPHTTDEEDAADYIARVDPGQLIVLPHVTGVCREFHNALTENEAWIRLEGDEFVVFEKTGDPQHPWERVGPLSPQPGGRDAMPRKKQRKSGEAKATRATITLRVPETEERPTLAEQYDDKLPRVEALLSDADKARSPIYTIVNALDYVLLNEGGPDA